MNLKITLARPLVNYTKPVTVRRWDDLHLYELDGMTTEGAVGSFQEVPLFHRYKDNPSNGEFNAISYYQRFGITERNYLISTQPNDFEKYGYTVAQKMNLLIENQAGNPPKQAYWIKNGGDWDTAQFTHMDFGTLVFGGQNVAVEMEGGKPKEYTFFGKYRARTTSEWIKFYKIVGMRRAEMSRPVAELFAEGKIQYYTVANKGAGVENVYNEHPRGYIYHPVWSPLDWRVNSGIADELYLAKEFCL